jgi:hypothetical protein
MDTMSPSAIASLLLTNIGLIATSWSPTLTFSGVSFTATPLSNCLCLSLISSCTAVTLSTEILFLAIACAKSDLNRSNTSCVASAIGFLNVSISRSITGSSCGTCMSLSSAGLLPPVKSSF